MTAANGASRDRDKTYGRDQVGRSALLSVAGLVSSFLSFSFVIQVPALPTYLTSFFAATLLGYGVRYFGTGRKVEAG